MNINELYKTYTNMYKNVAKTWKTQTGKDMIATMYNKTTFEAILEGYRNDDLENVKRGQKPLKDRDIIKKMVSNQRSEWNINQATAYARGVQKSLGVSVNPIDIMADPEPAKERIRIYAEELNAKGMNGKQIQAFIAIHIFGSDESKYGSL